MRRFLALMTLAALAPVAAAARAGDCPSCEGQAPPTHTVMINGKPVRQLCPTCAAQLGIGMPASEAPGVAQLGPMASHGGGAMVVSTEPMPMDVVRASYATGGKTPMMPGSATGVAGMPGMGHAGRPGPGMMAPGAAGPMETGSMPFLPPRGRRPSVIAHLFGLDGLSLSKMRYERYEREASRHAAMPLGNPGMAPVSTLPASDVYRAR
jgi:hypothetical protein